MSGKGEGKTKQLMEMMDNAAETVTGCMVCIEPEHNIGFSLRNQARMIDAGEYQLGTFDVLRGFLSGLYAGNYDISHVFIDNLLKIVKDATTQETESFLKWMDGFGDKCNIKFTVTISAGPESANDVMRRFM
jgi:hypothetical protein